MSAVIERMLADHLGTPVGVTSISRRPGRYPGISPVEVLTVGLRDGEAVTLFVKHLGPEQADHPDKLVRDREPLVYRRLLSGCDLPAPALYGSRRNPATGRHEVFLEHVDDWNLKYHGLEHWTTAAARLADLHAHFAARPEQLRRADFLLRLDQAYFRAWATRAVEAAGAASAELGQRLEHALRDHDEVAELLATQPPTLVHNDLAPKNVIADTSVEPARICFVDWEMAGAGCGLLDLVHLTHGLDAADERRVHDAYGAALADAPLIAACKLQNTLFRLAHVEAWQVEPSTTADWVDDVARLRAGV
jgi:aminoglycoside phosphotransferase (APT) family kinase protein